MSSKITQSIPMSKDWVFRSRKSQEELLENHPGVTRINVENRSNSKPTISGIPEVTLTIYGENQEVIKNCLTEGLQKIDDSLLYDIEKKQKKKAWRERQNQKSIEIAQERIREKFEGPKEKITRRDNALEIKFKNALNSLSPKKTPIEETNYTSMGNSFGSLFVEDSIEEQASRNVKKFQAKQTQAKQVQAKQVQAKKLTGWAKMAAKPAHLVEKPAHLVEKRELRVFDGMSVTSYKEDFWNEEW